MMEMLCAHCGEPNDWRTHEQEPASAALRCRFCGEPLADRGADRGAGDRLDRRHAEVLAAEGANGREVDVAGWVGRIGDYDRQVKYVQEGFWSKAKRYAAKVPFAKEVVSLYYCAVDPETPLKAKATAIGALAYWILPLDLIPDFVPMAGFADDATAVLIAYKSLSGQITEEHRLKAEQFFAMSKDFKVITRPD